jgi:hypothetical protein
MRNLYETGTNDRLLAHVCDHIATGRAQIDRPCVAMPLN